MSKKPVSNNDDSANSGNGGEGDSLANKESWESFNSGIIGKTDHFDLFISYKRDNGGDHGQKLAEELYEKLTADGYKVWLDNVEIGYSTNFEKRIEEAIVHSKKFVCILGPSWVNSPNCRYEFQKAVELEKRIIPINYQDFRTLLKEKKEEELITQHEWIRIDKPQEVDFQTKEKFAKSYGVLKSILDLKDKITERHNRILCDAYYWEMYDKPKSMLLDGAELSKVKSLRSKCNNDEESPSFSPIQDQYIEASETFVKKEISNKRKVFLSFDMHEAKYASELDMELRLHNISTWNDIDLAGEKKDDSFIEPILNCENVIDIVTDLGEVEEDHRVSFARSNNKPVIRITNSIEIQNEHKERGVKNVYYWDEHSSIDALIATINGDKVYNAKHAKLLGLAYEWMRQDKSDSKLLSYSEANSMQEWYQEADKLGTEPQPNADMIGFVERSVSHAVILRKKKKLILWSTIVGLLFLVVSVFLVFYFNKIGTDAIEKADVAIDRVREAKVSEKAAKVRENTAKESEEAEKKSKEAAEEASKISKEKEDSAIERERIATKKEASATKSALESKRIAAKAIKDADSAVARADSAIAKADTAIKLAGKMKIEAEKSVASALKEVESILEDSEEVRFKDLARVASKKAEDFIYSQEDEIAKKYADSAYYYLTDSIVGSAQTKILYNVYSELLPKESLLSPEYKKRGKTDLEQLTKRLKKDPDLMGNLYPAKYEEIDIYGRKIAVNHGANAFPSSTVRALFRAKEIDTTLVTALCIDSLGNRLAIGDQNGTIQIWDLKTQDSLDAYRAHWYRITSLSFSPTGKQLSAGSIDQQFSFVELQEFGGRVNGVQVFRQNNESTVNQVYYWGDHTVITVSWDEQSNAWGTNVGELKEELELKLDQKE